MNKQKETKPVNANAAILTTTFWMKTMTDVQQKKLKQQQQQEPNHKKSKMSRADCGYFFVSSLQLKIYNYI